MLVQDVIGARSVTLREEGSSVLCCDVLGLGRLGDSRTGMDQLGDQEEAR